MAATLPFGDGGVIPAAIFATLGLPMAPSGGPARLR